MVTRPKGETASKAVPLPSAEIVPLGVNDPVEFTDPCVDGTFTIPPEPDGTGVKPELILLPVDVTFTVPAVPVKVGDTAGKLA